MRRTLKLVLTGALGMSALALAQGTPPAQQNPAMQQKMGQCAQQMQSMKMTGDADHDFVSMMRMHQQHGIAMAQAELKNGKDPQARQLAQHIIETQQKELTSFDSWLSQHPAQGTGGGGTQGGRSGTP